MMIACLYYHLLVSEMNINDNNKKDVYICQRTIFDCLDMCFRDVLLHMMQ